MVEFFTIVQFSPGPLLDFVGHNRPVKSYQKLGTARGVRTQMQRQWRRSYGEPATTYYRILRTWIDGNSEVKVEWVD